MTVTSRPPGEALSKTENRGKPFGAFTGGADAAQNKKTKFTTIWGRRWRCETREYLAQGYSGGAKIDFWTVEVLSMA